MPVDGFRPGFGLIQIFRTSRDLIKGQGGPGHVGIIIEHGGMLGPAFAPAVVEAARRRQPAANESKDLFGGLRPRGLAEGGPGLGQGGDGEAVPVGQHLVVPQRRNAPAAHRQQHLAEVGQAGFGGGVGQLRQGGAVEDGVSLPIAARHHVVVFFEQRRLVFEEGVDPGLVPDVILALLAFAVGVIGAGQGEQAVVSRAVLNPHVAQHPGNRFAHADGIERTAGVEPGVGQQFDQQGIVVKHFFEMRRQPDGIGGVAGEAAAQVVIDAALAHAVQGNGNGLPEIPLAGPQPGPPQELEKRNLRKLGRPVGAAINPVNDAGGNVGGTVQQAGAEAVGALGL